MTAIFNGNSLDFIDKGGVIISTTDGYSSKNVSSLNGIFSLNSSNPTINNVIYNNNSVSEAIEYAYVDSYFIYSNNAITNITSNVWIYELMFPTMNISGGQSVGKSTYCSTILNNACTFNMFYNTTYQQYHDINSITGDWIIFELNDLTNYLHAAAENNPRRFLMSIRIVIHYDNYSNSDTIEYNTSGNCGWFASGVFQRKIPFTGMARYAYNSKSNATELYILISMITSIINSDDLRENFAIVYNPGILDTSISSATGSLMFTLASF